VETKRFVGSFVNVILTRQTCGQRSSRAAESKRRALEIIFPSEFAMCSLYQNVEETEIYICAHLCFFLFFFHYHGKIRKKMCVDVGKIGFCNCAADLKTKVKKLCTDTDLGLHYILLLGKYSKFARKNNFRALGVCSHSPARARAAGLPCHFWYSSK